MKVFVSFSESHLNFFGLLAEKKQCCQNSNLYFRQTFWGKQFECETYRFYCRSRTYSGIISDFLWKKTRVLSWLHSVSSWSFGRKLCFLRNIVFFSNQIRALTKDFGFFVTNSRDACQNCILSPIGTFYWRKPIFGKFHGLLNQFRILNRHFLGFWRKQFGMVAKIVFHEPGGHFWEKQGFKQEKILVFFGHWAKIVGTSAKKFCLRFPKCILRVQGKVFRNFSWGSIKYFLNFDLTNKISQVSVKLLSMCAEDSFDRKRVFFQKSVFSPRFSTWSKVLEGLPKLLIMSQEDSFEAKNTIEECLFFPSFLHLAQKCCTSTEKIQGGFSKLHSECPKDPSEGEHFFWEFFLSFSRFEEKTIEFLWRLSVAQSKTRFMCTEEILKNGILNFFQQCRIYAKFCRTFSKKLHQSCQA